MKSIKLFIIALLISCTTFAVLPSTALASDTPSMPGGGADPDATGSGSSLPIDGQVWFLIAAAAVVGTKVIISKSKTVKVAPEPIQ